MNSNTQEPLYKALNQQRTQGEVEVFTEDGHYSKNNHFLNVKDEPVTLAIIYGGQANAQYTALAVNNLHILAEGYEKFCADYMAGKPLSVICDNFHEYAKEALSKIS